MGSVAGIFTVYSPLTADWTVTIFVAKRVVAQIMLILLASPFINARRPEKCVDAMTSGNSPLD